MQEENEGTTRIHDIWKLKISATQAGIVEDYSDIEIQI